MTQKELRAAMDKVIAANSMEPPLKNQEDLPHPLYSLAIAMQRLQAAQRHHTNAISMHEEEASQARTWLASTLADIEQTLCAIDRLTEVMADE